MLQVSIPCRAVVIGMLAVSGCVLPPRSAAWNAEEQAIQPMGAEGKSSGSLIVETVFLGTDHGDDVRRPFFLYDEQGRYLTHYPNHDMAPVPLGAGRYVVVTGILNNNRRVQVFIKDGQTTTVRLSDFKSAPEAP